MWFLKRFGPRGQPRQHRARRRALARDAAPGAALRHRVAAPRAPLMILLARHGETDYNVARSLPGPARHAAQRHRPRAGARAGRARRRPSRRSRRCGASDLSRARETAEIVGARIGLEPRARRAPARGPTAATGRAACSTRSSATSPSATPPGARAGDGVPLPRRRVARASSRSACWPRSPTSRTASCRRWSSATAARSASCCAAHDPRGLDAFHEFEVPNVALVPVEAAGAVTRLARIAFGAARGRHARRVRRHAEAQELAAARRAAAHFSVFSPAPDARVHSARISSGSSTATTSASRSSTTRAASCAAWSTAATCRRASGIVLWNGRDDNGAIAPDGSYRVRVTLIQQGRTIELPQPIRLDTRRRGRS